MSKCSSFRSDHWIGFLKKSRSVNSSFALCFLPSIATTISLLSCLADRCMYDKAGLKVEHHIYENVGELRDATPDLILAVKPKVPLEDEQVRD